MFDYRLMVTAIYLASLSSVVYLVRSEISLSFTENKVTGLSFDGQPLDLYSETAISETLVIYKDWYEKTYGRCPPKTCYTCIRECYPYNRERHIVHSLDGSTLTTVLHHGTVQLDKHQIEMNFRLIIGWSPGPVRGGNLPVNYLGLAFYKGSPDENFLGQLFIKNVVSERRISICAPSDPQTFTGTIILGKAVKTQCKILSTPIISLPAGSSGFLDARFLVLGLDFLDGHQFEEYPYATIAAIDTGGQSIGLPKYYFQMILNMITESASGSPVYVKVKNDVWYIQQRGRDSFPTLIIGLGTFDRNVVVKIPVKRYLGGCDGTWCRLLLVGHDSPYILLGRPFLTSSFSSFAEDQRAQKTVTFAHYDRRGG
ncbi:hypothetical protein FOL47_008009 [Perkinsus chesapeaki]|uniref:Peptidase A1 domain-containing protein n=1 Tax=Perkinsus chesapeaki TaxID=330153 RepID=A0A7J6LGE7_PERCH|nr:hypothetical protein FOL47_008009 [Perkinsus chesapeaki]